ncbi:hypothetical protein B0H16DRAFT_1784652 [Mycena metata]|uniref:Uncharacterized protein n=1 Tax=Mycena metata TaxID=1033252 RepID=A0AAD7KGH6_9AGAR|nr:hypothetical protein B0H16DRAFT_1784652 [Mycena metata]
MEAVLSKILDWDSYQSPRPKNDSKPLLTTNIQGALERTLAGDLKSKDFSPRLHLVFKSWRQLLDSKKSGVPSLLAPFLAKNYANIDTVAALDPIDKLKLASIAPLAKAYGFDLHFVRVEHCRSKIVESYGYGEMSRYLVRSTYDSYGMDDDDDDDDFDADDIEMPSDSDDDGEGGYTVHFGSVIALDGFPMSFPGLIFDDDYKGEIFLNGKPEEGDRTADLSPLSYDRSFVQAGELTHVYKRTALLITAAEQTKKRIVAGSGWADFASNALSASLSRSPTAKEIGLKAALLKRSADKSHNYHDAPTFGALRKAAERWNDLALFTEVFQNCPTDRVVFTFGVEGLLSAYTKFGWKGVKDLYAGKIPQDFNKQLRAEAVIRLLEAAKAQKDTAAATSFAKDRDIVLDGIQTLDSSTESKEFSSITELILTTNNPGRFLFDSFFARLDASTPQPRVEIWGKLFESLRSDGRKLPAAKYAGLTKAIKSCIASKARSLGPFPLSNDWRGEGPSIDPLFSLLQISVRFEAFESLVMVFSSMRESKDRQTTEHPRAPASAYYKALTPKIGSLISSSDPGIGKHFSVFCDDALQMFLANVEDGPELFKVLIQYSSKPLEAANAVCSPDRMKELTKFKKHGFLKSLAELLAFSPVLRLDASSKTLATLKTLTERCLGAILLDLKAEHPQTILQDIDFAFRADTPAWATQVLDHILKSPDASDPEFIRWTLAEVLRGLPAILVAHKTSIAEPTYREFTSETVKSRLGRFPWDNLKAVSCGCIDCRIHLVPFLESARFIASIDEKQKIRTHLEKQLTKAKAESWGVTWTTIRVGRPHTLQIQKPEGLVAAGKWLENQKAAKTLLEVLGDVAQQTSILGVDFTWVSGTIAGTSNPLRLPLATKPIDGNIGTKRTSGTAEGAVSKKPRLS